MRNPPGFLSLRMPVKKIGILGGGQLGRMMLQEAANYPIDTYVLDLDPECPAARLCTYYVQGDINNFDAVFQFGKKVDVLTIEIEHVNIDALEKLEEEGLEIIPKPAVLRTIKNKILQKQYYDNHQIPTSPHVIVGNRTDIAEHEYMLPAVFKTAEGGYDGKGVQLVKNREAINDVHSAPGILEKMVDIKKEIAQLVAVDRAGNTALYPPVEMIFDPQLNLLDFQLCPADIDEKTLWRVEAIARSVAKNFKSPGLFAVEMFLDNQGQVLVNETAPRVHNSGHHTIEAHTCSQFDMLIRILAGYPLGDPHLLHPSLMVNIIGAEGYSGPVKYEGLEKVLSMENAFVHLYGKAETRPGRKMGHVTLLAHQQKNLVKQAHEVRKILLPKA